MGGFAGNEKQMRLQRRADENLAWSSITPGACIGGRTLATDDPDLLGWDIISSALARDGVFVFRMLPEADVAGVAARIEVGGYRMDWWNIFLGDRLPVLDACRKIRSRGLAEGLALTHATDGETLGRVQALLIDAGMAPFSIAMLSGRLCPALTLVLSRTEGEPLAVGHAYLPHNRHSRWHRHAWCGLIAVAKTERGKGLGALVNAAVLTAALERLDAVGAYEIVSEDNAASRKMVESCGLHLEPGLRTGVATSDVERFTR
jgi:GNAT superfamily N-acetyltransferase